MVSFNPMRLFSSFWLEAWLFWTSKSSDNIISPPADFELLWTSRYSDDTIKPSADFERVSQTAKNRRGESTGSTHRKPPQSETEARNHIESIIKRRGPDSQSYDYLQAALSI